MIWRTLAAVAALSVASPAMAVECGSAKEILDIAKTRYNEVPAFSAMLNGAPIVVTVSPGGSWTLFAQPAPDKLCHLADGEGWSAMSREAEAPKAAPQSLPAPVLLPNGQRRI